MENICIFPLSLVSSVVVTTVILVVLGIACKSPLLLLVLLCLDDVRDVDESLRVSLVIPFVDEVLLPFFLFFFPAMVNL